MSLYTLILNPGLPTNQKQFLIRNRTNHDIMLKITSTVPKAFEFEANKIVVGSHKYTVVNMTYIEKELSTSQQHHTDKIFIYARPVTRYNQDCLRRWLITERCEKKIQLAYSIDVVVSDMKFSANKLILDLPGNASLIDPISHPIHANLDQDCSTAISVEADTDTAQKFDSNDFQMPIKYSALRNEKVEDTSYRCSLLAPLIGTLFLPIQSMKT